MGENKTNAELDYIVWQYLEKETPSLATEFQKLKNLKTKAGAKVTLNSIYDIYTKNKPSAAKRQNKNENSKAPLTKKVCLHEDENGKENDNITEINEKDNSVEEDEKPVNDNLAIESDDMEAKSADNKKPLLDENSWSAKRSPEDKPAKSQSNNKRKRKALLPKPKKKKTLLAAPFTSLHQNDPKFYYRNDTRKTLLPEPSPLIPTRGPQGRKTLLAEPLYNPGRSERKPLLSDMPTPAYSDDERGRKTLLSEPLPLLTKNERAKKPLLMEPVPPPLMRENARRTDRMGLLSESPPLYPDSSERMALLSYPSMSDQLDALYRRERKSLLDEPPMALQEYLRKKKESLLIDPASDHYYDSRERKVRLLSDMPLPLGIEDTDRKKRVLLPDRPQPLSQGEYAIDSLGLTESADCHLYNKKETSLLPKPLFSDKEYDDSPPLYSRRIQAKKHVSDSSKLTDKQAWLAELENYLKKHLSRSPERMSSTAERSRLLEKPIDSHDYEEIEKKSRMPNLSQMSQDSYAYCIQEKNASMARKDYLNFIQKAMSDKSGADFTRMEIMNRNEALLRNYEEELKSIGLNMTSDVNSSLRRTSEKDFHSLDQDAQRRLFERFGGKLFSHTVGRGLKILRERNEHFSESANTSLDNRC